MAAHDEPELPAWFDHELAIVTVGVDETNGCSSCVLDVDDIYD
jgi:hypothetical protein